MKGLNVTHKLRYGALMLGARLHHAPPSSQLKQTGWNNRILRPSSQKLISLNITISFFFFIIIHLEHIYLVVNERKYSARLWLQQIELFINAHTRWSRWTWVQIRIDYVLGACVNLASSCVIWSYLNRWNQRLRFFSSLCLSEMFWRGRFFRPYIKNEKIRFHDMTTF